MTIRDKLEFKNGVIIIHFRSINQDDYGLCGADLAGDSVHEFGAYEASKQTSSKVNCSDCIRIVNYCKKIKRNEYE